MIEEILGRYLLDVEQKMRQILTTDLSEENKYGVMLRYALGWVDEEDNPYTEKTGKRLRPILLLLCAEAAGGNKDTALPAAAAVELLHNFSLIHDDIQDESDIRHNRPTVWRIWGRANAINAGDAMFTLAYSAMADLASHLSAELTLDAWRIFNATNLELTRGQHLDMLFETQAMVTVERYISMISGKSAALLAACAQIGALVATGDPNIANQYASFGKNIGIAFQIHDDILGIWGDPSVTGKSIATDIVSRKKSLPVLFGLTNSADLRVIYQQDSFSEADVTSAVALLDAVGAQEYTREQEKLYFDRAITALDAANPQGKAAEYLQDFVDFLFKRSY